MAVDPAKTYNGGACASCGETLRWLCSGNCVACKRLRTRNRRDYFRAYRQRQREDHVTYYRTLLDNRRRAALKRMEARHGALSG